MTASRWILPAAVALLLGGGAGFLLAQPRPPAAQEVAFVQDMITHHIQAVDMANRMYQRMLQTPEATEKERVLQYLAYDILATQTNQNGQMMGWLNLWNQPVSSSNPMDPDMMGMATQQQVEEISTLPLKEAKIQFLQLMIRHHQGAVHMVEDLLPTAKTPVVRLSAEKTLQAQSTEIQAMTEMLQDLGAEPLPPLDPHSTEHGSEHGH